MNDTGMNAAAVGMFDGVHCGHRDIMDTVRSCAARLGGRPVILTFADHPLSLLRPADEPRLLCTPDEKKALIQEYLPDARVVMLDFGTMRGVTAREFLMHLRDSLGVRAIVMGYDNRFGCDGPRDREAYNDLARELGMEIHHVGRRHLDGTTASSSEVRRLLLAGDVAAAASMLGRCYSVGGTVEHGRELGRTIGFPTANLKPDSGKLLPAAGVYAAVATVEGSGKWPAMVNIGHRPTVDRAPDAPLTVEAHLIGAEEDLYGRRMTLAFVARLRQEQRFDSVEQLARQLEADRTLTLKTVGQCLK